MHRYLAAPQDITNSQARVKDEEYRHMTKVLRQKPGQEIVVFDGMGNEYQGVIEELGKEEAVIRLGQHRWLPRESRVDLWLVQGIPKGEKMEFIIQKNTELGVKGFFPLEADRTIVKLEDKKKNDRQKRWQKVAAEAAKQCKRAYVPRVTPIHTLREFLAGISGKSIILAPWEEGGQPLKQVLLSKAEKECYDYKVYIMIGPEGGWEMREIDLIKKSGGIPVSLGPRILRTETAGLAAVSAIMYQWGDLGGM